MAPIISPYKSICLIVVLLVVASPALATTISATETGSHIGQDVTVEGVASVHVSRNATFIDIGGKYASS